jgi:hypothetical protein
MAFTCVRTIAELGPELVLAPERHRAASLQNGPLARRTPTVTLGSLVIERSELVEPRAASGEAIDAVILDTTHVRDGVIDLAAARRSVPSTGSPKRRVEPGDLLVSRLRPYLRQIGYAHPALFAELGATPLLVSSEFVVLRAQGETDLAFLLPLLLGAPAQAVLAAGQEGGHHPRVPRATLLALAVPLSLVKNARRESLAVRRALARFHRASFALDRTLRGA